MKQDYISPEAKSIPYRLDLDLRQREPGDDDGPALLPFDKAWSEPDPWVKIEPVQTAFDFEKSPLGNIWEITQPPPEDVEKDSLFSRAQKWKRLNLRRAIIPTKEAECCHRASSPIRTPDGSLFPRKKVGVLKSSSNRFSYRGLITCGNIWQCAVCASKISESRRVELTEALKVADEKGVSVLHLTLTAPHHLGENLGGLVGKMGHAKRLMQNRKPWIRFAKSMGLAGTIRALELTHSWNNGWHVHFHVLLFLEQKFEEETRKESISALEDLIFEMWKAACISAGLESPSKLHGVKLQDHADDYVGKWGSEHEMTKAHLKKGHEDNLTPFQFLDEYGAGDDRYKGIFLEYATEFKGKKQLVWSKGLRKLLGIGTELTDQEIAEKDDPDSKLFAEIPIEVWKEVARREKMGELLEICRKGIEALSEYLNKLKMRMGNEKI